MLITQFGHVLVESLYIYCISDPYANDPLLLKYTNKVIKKKSNPLCRGKYKQDKLRLVGRVVEAARESSKENLSTDDIEQRKCKLVQYLNMHISLP